MRRALLIGAVTAAVSLLVAGSAPAVGFDPGIPTLLVAAAVDASPKPTSRKSIPTSLRLANSISSIDGSHPVAAKEVAFSVDRHFDLDLSATPRCPYAPLQVSPPFDWERCAGAEVAGGRIKWEVAFPEAEPFRFGAPATVYKKNRRELLVRAELRGPIDAEVVFPIKVGEAPEGPFDTRLTVAIPKVAGGSASLVYLGFRFRTGLFSAACPHGRFQFRLDDTFVDGARYTSSLFEPC